ncbi:TetR/AcrR family transcriptional regulator [Paenibacillus albidus]|uniref:TetR/AcrR family transcriptional regulator n=1 Tax=Paenibacillus albidus TaxID=2041023 RepID=UPI001BE621F5|nr:TetR/AcrR family transcriptional regulator [Paenibacillus albidus]MBT2290527.1 TetR/AcrR family transcriptional regulator [Paenibacillus albidus]
MTEPELDIKMRILLAAKKLFAKQGYDGTSVRQICQEAGANVSLVSYYFGGKEKVFEALLENFFPSYLLDGFNAYEVDPVTGIRQLVGEVVNFTLQDREMSDIVQLEVMLRSCRTDIVMRCLHPVWSNVRIVLKRGQEQDLFTFQSITHAMLQVMGAALAHKRAIAFEALLAADPLAEEQLADQTIQFVLSGLGVTQKAVIPE